MVAGSALSSTYFSTGLTLLRVALRRVAGLDQQVVDGLGLVGCQFRVLLDGLRPLDDQRCTARPCWTCAVGVTCRLAPGQRGVGGDEGHRCAPRITQTMNEMSKCRNALNSDGAWPLFFRSLSFTVSPL